MMLSNLIEWSESLRRIAWAMQMPMTKAMKEVFGYLPKILDKKRSVKDAGIGLNARNVLSDQSKSEEGEFPIKPLLEIIFDAARSGIFGRKEVS